MSEPKRIEYRVIPVTRYLVTRYAETERASGCKSKGEFDNEDLAYEVALALCSEEHQRLGWDVGAHRILYPDRHKKAAAARERELAAKA